MTFVLTFVLIIKQRLALPSARLGLRDLSYHDNSNWITSVSIKIFAKLKR